MPPIYVNGHISATGDSIHFMFGSRVGFSLFPVRTNPRWRLPPCWKNFKWPYLRNRLSFMFGSWVEFSGTADLMALFSIRTDPRWRRPPSWIISNGHISATAHTIYLYSAHRAGHLCDSTAFLFLFLFLSVQCNTVHGTQNIKSLAACVCACTGFEAEYG